MTAFPQLPKDFYSIFQKRVIENDFSDQRLNDAVNNVIDTCVYPTPTVANFLSYDKKVKLYTHDQLVDMVDKHGSSVFENYRPVKIDGYDIPFYASLEDINQYGLKSWKQIKENQYG